MFTKSRRLNNDNYLFKSAASLTLTNYKTAPRPPNLTSLLC